MFTTTPGSSVNQQPSSHYSSFDGPTLSPAGRYALPPAYAVCTFLDGGVGLYDLGKRRWFFLRDQAGSSRFCWYFHTQQCCIPPMYMYLLNYVCLVTNCVIL